ncbi:unnamed protein product [Effrenium voratum]|uniref:Uncharacterized protein n=1 Tax=Effrenium voratum TaxID=2562239 RepID=A0AA36IV66_9DINO|nr:unnamed protein product [Effrenium voratum]CAJ1456318.1 unnamed protein product [Effrenium voratum]
MQGDVRNAAMNGTHEGQIEKSIVADLRALKHVEFKSATLKTFIAELTAGEVPMGASRQARSVKKRNRIRPAPRHASQGQHSLTEMVLDGLQIELERMCASSRSSQPGAVGRISMKPAMPPMSAILSMPC